MFEYDRPLGELREAGEEVGELRVFHGVGRLDQRFRAARRACLEVRALALPVPALPPREPRRTAAGFLVGLVMERDGLGICTRR